MQNENVLNKRHEWSLLPYAERKLVVHQSEESSLRKKLASALESAPPTGS